MHGVSLKPLIVTKGFEEDDDGGGMGERTTPFFPLYPRMVNLSSHLSHLF
jgi:hypothetical protein